MAGKGYNALPFVFDLVNQVNRVSVPNGKKKADPSLPAETRRQRDHPVPGEHRRSFIGKITGDHSASFGLHPVVYFYTRTGAFQPSAFFAASRFIEATIASGKVKEFLRPRAKFEAFLLKFKEHVSLTVHKFGAGERSVPQLVLYSSMYSRLSRGAGTTTRSSPCSPKSPNFQYLLPAKPPLLRGPAEDTEEESGLSPRYQIGGLHQHGDFRSANMRSLQCPNSQEFHAHRS